MNPAQRAAALEERIRTQIPLAAAMGVRVRSCEDHALVLAAPLAPNLNDKGTGFAGSLATLVTLAGWGLVTLAGEQASGDARCEVAVVRSELEFLRPVREELVARAQLADPELWARLPARLAAGRRVRVEVQAVLGSASDPAVRFRGDYALWRAGTQPF